MRTAQFIQYLPSYAYPNGAVRVTVRVADLAGNTTDEIVELHDSSALMDDCIFCKIARARFRQRWSIATRS